jgi:hypothetical protein
MVTYTDALERLMNGESIFKLDMSSSECYFKAHGYLGDRISKQVMKKLDRFVRWTNHNGVEIAIYTSVNRWFPFDGKGTKGILSDPEFQCFVMKGPNEHDYDETSGQDPNVPIAGMAFLSGFSIGGHGCILVNPDLTIWTLADVYGQVANHHRLFMSRLHRGRRTLMLSPTDRETLKAVMAEIANAVLA